MYLNEWIKSYNWGEVKFETSVFKRLKSQAGYFTG